MLKLYFALALATIFASAATAETLAPTLNSVTRSSGSPFAPNGSFMFQYSFTNGTNKVIFMEFGFSDPNGFHRRTFLLNPPANNYVWTTVERDWPNGSYTVDYVMMEDLLGTYTTYKRNGTIEITNGNAVAPSTHSLNLATLDFQVTGAGTPITLARLTSISRTTASPAVANSPITFSYTVTPGDDSIRSIDVVILQPSGGRSANATTTGVVSNSGVASVTPPVSWANGPYQISGVVITDSTYRTITYDRDGLVTVKNGAGTLPSTHSFDLSSLDFVLSGATDLDLMPRITSFKRSSVAAIAPTERVNFDYSLMLFTSSINTIDVFVRDPNGATREILAGGTLKNPGAISMTADTDWPDGNYVIQYILMEDSSHRVMRFYRDGSVTVTNDSIAWPLTHKLDLPQSDFRVTRSPVIVTAPQSTSVTRGSSAALAVVAAGLSPLTYQWMKNGTNITGATTASLTLTDVQLSDAGNYSVAVSNSLGSVSSAAVALSVTSLPGSPTFISQPSAQTVKTGTKVSLTVSATGNAPLAYQWKKDGAVIAGATAPTFEIAAAQPSDAGSYVCTVSNTIGASDSTPAALTVSGPNAWLTNVSIRTTMSSGQGPLIVGLTVGEGNKDVLIRASGPALTTFGLSGVMADPRLDLFRAGSSTAMASNDNWDAAMAGAFAAVGAFGFANGSKDAALMPSLNGGYSVHAPATGVGTVLVEAYDTNPKASSPRLTNISARSVVGTGDDILIAGFAVTGSGTKRLLIRGVGQKLSDFGVSHVLADPLLQVYDSNRKLVAENNDWDSALSSTFSSVGAFALNTGSKDAALVADLPPGTYSVQVKGADGGTGEAIVELYEVP